MTVLLWKFFFSSPFFFFFFFFLLPSLPLACVALPDRSSRNAISLVQRLSFGENEDVVKHLGMIYLSLDHGAPMYQCTPFLLFILFVSCLCRKKIYVDSREMHSLFVIFPDKSKGQAQLPLSTNFFSTGVNQLAKLYRRSFPDVPFFVTNLVNNDFIFISKR